MLHQIGKSKKQESIPKSSFATHQQQPDSSHFMPDALKVPASCNDPGGGSVTVSARTSCIIESGIPRVSVNYNKDRKAFDKPIKPLLQDQIILN